MTKDKALYTQEILERLSGFEGVTSKSMFGGVGFFKEKTMFGGIMDGKFRLRADESSKHEFEELGGKRYTNESKGKGMPYWEVPDVIYSDPKTLAKWAKRAYDVALKAKK